MDEEPRPVWVLERRRLLARIAELEAEAKRCWCRLPDDEGSQ